ncbi:NADP-dependent alcohol dehydrogenase C 2 [Penicillium rolfsii]|nr:NADP-dependent alcohol dehydrogenase C 2 [Penicillium rolfsii]
MGVEIKYIKGSQGGEVVEAVGSRELEPTHVAVKITHCGVCGTDEHFRHVDQGLGHEGVGIITEVGSSVHALSEFRVGDRVGMGWFHKYCGHCKYCVTGRQTMCINRTSFGTADQDQGCFGTAVTWDISAVYKIPDAIASEDAGPLLCGGATVWSPLYDYGGKFGDRVGIIGIGGLGHMAIQFASKMGYEVVVFSSTESKKQEALSFGASEFHATSDKEAWKSIEKLDFLIITASFNTKLSMYWPILAHGAKIFPLTISPENLDVSPLNLVVDQFQLIGTNVADTPSMNAMLQFAAKNGIKPQIEKSPLTLTGVKDAMQKLRDGKMRYRGVLVAP